jgi:2-oxo-4-hydroxy-4-carboxy--5-ureidoimidazoline (OHCU) decarboxylase
MPDIETKARKEENTDLEQLRQQYLEKFGKPVTNFKKNDAERIKNKLAE